MLAAPQSPGYVDDNDPAIPLQGDFTIEDYLGYESPSNQAAVASTLRRAGFMGGFAHTWMDSGSSHLLLEVVMAFSGGWGAADWLKASEKADKADIHYVHPISVSGLDRYYGWHSAAPGNPEYADLVAFVKGNDYFIVIADSIADDLGNIAVAQSENQFRAAPPYTIPPTQWPENRRSLAAYFAILAPVIAALDGVVLAGLGVTGLILWQRSRRPRRSAK